MMVDGTTLGILGYTLSTSIGAAVWVAKLTTRVAVLEAGHDIMADLLQEIKMDIKELVNALHGSELLARQARVVKKKP